MAFLSVKGDIPLNHIAKLQHLGTHFVARSCRPLPAVQLFLKISIDAKVFGDEPHLAGGITVAVTVPARLLQGCHQLRTTVDVLTQFLHRRLYFPGMRRINTGQLPFQIFTIFYCARNAGRSGSISTAVSPPPNISSSSCRMTSATMTRPLPPPST